jgi:hypothetical protein
MASNCFPFLNTGQMFAVFYMAGVVPDSQLNNGLFKSLRQGHP